MRDLSELQRRSEELEVLLAKKKRRIAALAQLAYEDDDIKLTLRFVEGLRDACRTALRASRKEWVTVPEIQQVVAELGFPVHELKAPAASITTTVNRLVKDEEVLSRVVGGKREYKWALPKYGASGGLANSMADADRDRAKKRQ